MVISISNPNTVSNLFTTLCLYFIAKAIKKQINVIHKSVITKEITMKINNKIPESKHKVQCVDKIHQNAEFDSYLMQSGKRKQYRQHTVYPLNYAQLPFPSHTQTHMNGYTLIIIAIDWWWYWMFITPNQIVEGNKWRRDPHQKCNEGTTDDQNELKMEKYFKNKVKKRQPTCVQLCFDLMKERIYYSILHAA